MKRSLITLVAVLAACVNPTASAVNWVVDANGNWTTDANWDAANPSGAGAVADFSTLDISADHTVTLDANRTVGTLRLGDTGGTVYSWTLSGANALTLQASSGSATLAVNQGTANLIAVPVTLNDPVTATVAATARLEISGNITGVAKDMWLPANFGTLRLSGNNSGWSGMLRMNGSNLGTIEVTNNNSLGTLNLNPYSYGGGPLRINNVSGGALTLPVGWTPTTTAGIRSTLAAGT